MSFYSSISNYYDLLFPVSSEQENFFAELVRDFKPARILDAACGSGNQMLCLAKRGLDCSGFDADKEMVKLAREKLRGYRNATVKEGTFNRMHELFEPGFDLIMNLGNSLVHVPNDEAAQFILDAKEMLNNQGILLIQILNYDRIFERKIEELPLISVSEHDLSFKRSYMFTSNEKVIFKTSIEVPSEGITISDSWPLYPLRKDHLLDIVSAAGLNLMGLYHGFMGKKFVPESDAIVLMAKK